MVTKNTLTLFSRIVSYIFEPINVYSLVMFYLLFINKKLSLFSYEFFLYLVLPAILLILFLKIHGFRKIDLSKYALRKKLVFRIYPIFVTVMLISIFFINDINAHILLTLCISLWVISLLCTKTSAHVYFFITLPSLINLDEKLVFVILAISVFIAYARLKLHRHTLKDLFVAYFVAALYYLFYFGLIQHYMISVDC